MSTYQLFKAQISSTSVADALHEEDHGKASRSPNYGIVTKVGRYAAAFLMIGVSALTVGAVFTGLLHGFWQVFTVQCLAYALFYYGQKLAWLTYDPKIMTRGDRAREARIKKRVAAIQRTRVEREQAEGIRRTW